MSDADRHAAERERKRRKARYGMQVSGRSTRLLLQLQQRRKPPKRRRRPAR